MKFPKQLRREGNVLSFDLLERIISVFVLPGNNQTPFNPNLINKGS